MTVRQLTKGPQPATLVANQGNWTATYVGHKGNSRTRPRPWGHVDIMTALIAETYGKCAYCEAVIGDVSYAHVEHITPKSIAPHRVVDWLNLTLACQVCNTMKGDYYDEDAPLVNPYVDDPRDDLRFLGPLISAALGSAKGERTIRRVGLMREALFLERLKRIEALHIRLERWQRALGADKDVYAADVLDAIGEDQEFSQALREYANALGFC